MQYDYYGPTPKASATKKRDAGNKRLPPPQAPPTLLGVRGDLRDDGHERCHCASYASGPALRNTNPAGRLFVCSLSLSRWARGPRLCANVLAKNMFQHEGAVTLLVGICHHQTADG